MDCAKSIEKNRTAASVSPSESEGYRKSFSRDTCTGVRCDNNHDFSLALDCSWIDLVLLFDSGTLGGDFYSGAPFEEIEANQEIRIYRMEEEDE
jgi:hypothetical protein